MNAATIDKLFSYHPPKDNQPERYDKIRSAAKTFALVLLECTPEGPDQSVAIRKLRECVMTANAAVALEGDELPTTIDPASLLAR